MKSFTYYLENKKNYDFSSVLYILPDKIAKKIEDWGKKNIKDEDLSEDGREDNIHCTVIYGIHDKTSKNVRKVLKEVKTFPIELGKISTFSSENYDVLKIDVTGSGLHRLNRILKNEIKCTTTYPVYKPHITIAYLKKGIADKHVGYSGFSDLKIDVSEVVFSSRAGIKTPIRLN